MVNFVSLGWDRSILESSVERICQECATANNADFSGTLFITPTAESGRLLREELAKSFSSGVTNLQVGLPERVLANDSQNTLSKTLTMHYWLASLKEVTTDELAKLFHIPNSESEQSSTTMLANIATILQRCRTILAGEGLSIDMVCQKLATMEGEIGYEAQERYQAFQILEQNYLNSIPNNQLDTASAILQNIQNPKLDSSIHRVVVIGCMELKGAVIKALQNLQVEVEIWASIPEEERNNFDSWGRPLIESYLTKVIDFDLEKSLRFLPKPEDQATRIANELLALPKNNRPALIGILDGEVTNFLLDKCQLNNQLPKLYTPQNRPLISGKLTSLLVSLLGFIGDSPTFALGQNLLQSSLLQSWLKKQLSAPKMSELLIQLEQIKNESILESWLELRKSLRVDTPLTQAVDLLNLQRESLRSADNTLKELWGFFAQILESSKLSPTDYMVTKEIDTLKQLLVEVINLPINNVLQRVIFLTLLRETNLPSQPNLNGSAEIAGFLELNWRKADALLIAGFNEESFKYGSEADIFLPMNLKKQLGMLTNDNYYVADVVRFIQLCRSKKITLLGSRGSTTGEILRPARLLLQTANEDLAQRCQLLFSNQLNERPPMPKISPESSGNFPPFLPQFTPIAHDTPMSITGFKSYMECPFKFYREKVLKCRELLTNEHELNAASWGTVIHKILEKFGQQQNSKLTEDEVFERCQIIATEVERRQFANPSQGVLSFQLELLEDTLKGFALIESSSLLQGWRTEEVEYEVKFVWQELYSKIFPNEEIKPWRQSINLKGLIDRLDRRGDNEWRIVDYKTANAATEPFKTHLAKNISIPNGDKESAEYLNRQSMVPNVKWELFWVDLQLPLYLLATKYLYPKVQNANSDQFSAVYYNLPLAYSGAKVNEFEGLNTPELLESAVRCADWILEEIYLNHNFWPPRETSNYNNNFAKALGEFSVELFMPQHLWEVK